MLPPDRWAKINAWQIICQHTADQPLKYWLAPLRQNSVRANQPVTLWRFLNDTFNEYKLNNHFWPSPSSLLVLFPGRAGFLVHFLRDCTSNGGVSDCFPDKMILLQDGSRIGSSFQTISQRLSIFSVCRASVAFRKCTITKHHILWQLCILLQFLATLSLQSMVYNDPFVVQQQRICKTFGSMSVQTVRAAAQKQQHTSHQQRRSACL